jgi:hypothetical protein
MELSPVVSALLTAFETEKPSSREGHHLNVSKTISILARIYEKARNAVEFRAEHLVRRAAIERILKRRILLGGGANDMAENLVVELLWARYIDSALIDKHKIIEIDAIITRYMLLKRDSFHSAGKNGGIPWETIMALLSSEIEDALVSGRKREALNNFVYQAMRPNVHIADGDERYVNMQTYIAVERAFAQSDDALVTYELMRMIQPSWFGLDADKSTAEFPLLLQNLRLVKTSLHDPVGEALTRYMRHRTPPFLLLRDFLLEHGDTAAALINNKTEFENTLREIANKRYKEIGTKVRRAVVRSIIYIFLTKMIFAFALEAPFDLFISKKIEYLALGINAIFPPVLLFLVAGFQSVPGEENTKRLIARIDKIIYDFDFLKNETDIFTPRLAIRRPLLTAVFSIFYLATYLLVFGCIAWGLNSLHFNIASQIIFVFFVTLVSFFAYRIRVSAKEYEMTDREGFFGPLVDFFFLPVLRVGHWLSGEIAKINIFIFLFDFILEAPLKVIFEVAEEWIRFIRTKKEEIV